MGKSKNKSSSKNTSSLEVEIKELKVRIQQAEEKIKIKSAELENLKIYLENLTIEWNKDLQILILDKLTDEEKLKIQQKYESLAASKLKYENNCENEKVLLKTELEGLKINLDFHTKKLAEHLKDLEREIENSKKIKEDQVVISKKLEEQKKISANLEDEKKEILTKNEQISSEKFELEEKLKLAQTELTKSLTNDSEEINKKIQTLVDEYKTQILKKEKELNDNLKRLSECDKSTTDLKIQQSESQKYIEELETHLAKLKQFLDEKEQQLNTAISPEQHQEEIKNLEQLIAKQALTIKELGEKETLLEKSEGAVIALNREIDEYKRNQEEIKKQIQELDQQKKTLEDQIGQASLRKDEPLKETDQEQDLELMKQKLTKYDDFLLDLQSKYDESLESKNQILEKNEELENEISKLKLELKTGSPSLSFEVNKDFLKVCETVYATKKFSVTKTDEEIDSFITSFAKEYQTPGTTLRPKIYYDGKDEETLFNAFKLYYNGGKKADKEFFKQKLSLAISLFQHFSSFQMEQFITSPDIKIDTTVQLAVTPYHNFTSFFTKEIENSEFWKGLKAEATNDNLKTFVSNLDKFSKQRKIDFVLNYKTCIDSKGISISGAKYCEYAWNVFKAFETQYVINSEFFESRRLSVIQLLSPFTTQFWKIDGLRDLIQNDLLKFSPEYRLVSSILFGNYYKNFQYSDPEPNTEQLKELLQDLSMKTNNTILYEKIQLLSLGIIPNYLYLSRK
jgi:hypothetical protein